ncbi:MAG TPA: hypothetical protein VJ123_01540 [Anaerolineales bacterium]|nr:hypothetical protein [Anaerolineales bacterium]
MSSWTFAAQVLPHFVIAVVGTAVGFSWSPRVAPEWILPVGLAAFLLFVAAVTFRRSSGWNVTFLFLFAFSVGAFSGQVLPHGGLDWRWATGFALGVLATAAATGSPGLYTRLGRVWSLIWVLSWAYVAGWALFLVWDVLARIMVGWTVAGLLVFTVLAVGWFSRLRTASANPTGASLALELYIIAFNLAVAARMLGHGLGLR